MTILFLLTCGYRRMQTNHLALEHGLAPISFLSTEGSDCHLLFRRCCDGCVCNPNIHLVFVVHDIQ